MAVLLVALARSEDTQAKTTPDVIHLDLMRYNHENSPFATSNQSQEDQSRIAVERSRQRAEWFNSQTNSKNEESNSPNEQADGPSGPQFLSTPLYSVQCDYVMQVNVGTPPQTKVAIADTGSDLFWLECLYGLVGLGRGPLSIIRQFGFTAFSYCLTSFCSSKTKTSPLILGDADGWYSYTPLIVNSAADTFYYVGLIAILVNGIPLSIPCSTFEIDSQGHGGTIVDSGTTFTQLQEAAYTPLLNKVRSLITYTKVNGSSVGLDACYRPGTPSPIWPTVTLVLSLGVKMVLPGDNLFLLVDNSGDYCMAIMSSGSSRLGIIGNVQQQNFNIKFDLANNQLGLSPTTC
ncbi:unnamed protein product [Calypogeia fissa]